MEVGVVACRINRGYCGNFELWHGVGRAGKGPLGVFCPGNGIFH